MHCVLVSLQSDWRVTRGICGPIDLALQSGFHECWHRLGICVAHLAPVTQGVRDDSRDRPLPPLTWTGQRWTASAGHTRDRAVLASTGSATDPRRPAATDPSFRRPSTLSQEGNSPKGWRGIDAKRRIRRDDRYRARIRLDMTAVEGSLGGCLSVAGIDWERGPGRAPTPGCVGAVPDSSGCGADRAGPRPRPFTPVRRIRESVRRAWRTRFPRIADRGDWRLGQAGTACPGLRWRDPGGGAACAWLGRRTPRRIICACDDRHSSTSGINRNPMPTELALVAIEIGAYDRFLPI